jgi:hypothetical protein
VVSWFSASSNAVDKRVYRMPIEGPLTNNIETKDVMTALFVFMLIVAIVGVGLWLCADYLGRYSSCGNANN